MQKDTNVDIMEQAQVQAQLDQLRQEFSAQLSQAAGEIDGAMERFGATPNCTGCILPGKQTKPDKRIHQAYG